MASDPTARRAAMAEAIRSKLAELYIRLEWKAATVADELAEAADVAAQECEGKDET